MGDDSEDMGGLDLLVLGPSNMGDENLAKCHRQKLENGSMRGAHARAWYGRYGNSAKRIILLPSVSNAVILAVFFFYFVVVVIFGLYLSVIKEARLQGKDGRDDETFSGSALGL